jgi:hypothetical protein
MRHLFFVNYTKFNRMFKHSCLLKIQLEKNNESHEKNEV